MRCPKCGYISFDHLDSCKKCKKDISVAAEELAGVVYDVAAPDFLALDGSENGGTAGAMTEAVGFDEVVEEEQAADLSFADELDFEAGEAELDLTGAEGEEEAEVELSLGEEEEFGLDLDLSDESAEEEVSFESDEITLDFDEAGQEETPEPEADEEQVEGLPLDFGEIDISDLAPPEEGSVEEASGELPSQDMEDAVEIDLDEELSLAAGTPSAGAGLEDLQIDDLDLETPAPLVVGSKAGDKLMPSVKTGTALDNFEIDLGELTTDEK